MARIPQSNLVWLRSQLIGSGGAQPRDVDAKLEKILKGNESAPLSQQRAIVASAETNRKLGGAVKA